MDAESVHKPSRDSNRDHNPRRRRPESKPSPPPERNMDEDVASMLRDKEEYRGLLRHRGPQAQEAMDRLQHILDSIAPRSALRKQVTVALQRLSIRTGLFPSVYELRGVKKHKQAAVSSGGYGEVYEGEYEGHQVCIKMLWINQQDRRKIMKFYAREAILWRQLAHPNILPFYGISTLDSRPCLVSPWAVNGNVVDFLGSNPQADRLALVQDVTAGLAYLHAQEIVHGDLKGANVLVNRHGHACLADFGLSSVYDCGVLDWTSQSAAASIGGSIRWQAPELLDEETFRNTKASDMYAWGCVCFEIFTGEIPYASIKATNPIYAKKLQGIPPSYPYEKTQEWIDNGLRDDIWDLLHICWDSQPENRPTIATVQVQIGGRPARINHPNYGDDFYFQHVYRTPFFFFDRTDAMLLDTDRLTHDIDSSEK